MNTNVNESIKNKIKKIEIEMRQIEQNRVERTDFITKQLDRELAIKVFSVVTESFYDGRSYESLQKTMDALKAELSKNEL